jgi:RNA polymerase sigma factor (sigma-70 family)
MHPRQSITDLFSTFVQFEADRFSSWATDARLRRNIKACLNRIADAQNSEKFWAVYWHKCWCQEQNEGSPSPSPSFSLAHMSAYLQEACYWSAQKMMPRVQGLQYNLSDFFQVAIAELPKILKACDPDINGNLKAYASKAFGSIIRDYLRQRREIDFCTDWGLLFKVSRKRLRESLENAGLGSETIESYLLAWTCFENIYLPKKSPQLRQISAPDRETWEAIVCAYNKLRYQQLSFSTPECTKETLERWLTYSASRVRSYLYPNVASLNSPKPGQVEGELQDDLTDPIQESLLVELIDQEQRQERLQQQIQINQVIEEALTKLEPSLRELIQLYYQQGLTQQEIAQKLGIQQYNVSRKLAKTRESLLLVLTRWIQENLHISVTSYVVKDMSTLLEEWLQQRLPPG